MTCSGQDKKTAKKLPTADWLKETYKYAAQVIPKEIEYSGNNYDLTPIHLKSAVTTTFNNRPVVIAICSVETSSENQSALTYFLIDPRTNSNINSDSVITIKGCDADIPAFTFRDIDNDKKEEFIFITSYNDKCTGEYWVKSDIVPVGKTQIKNNLEDYLKLRNNTSLNRTVSKVDAAELQKILEATVSELFNK